MIVELRLGHCRWRLLAEELHAIVRQPLLDLGNVRTVARLHCAEHVNSRQIRAGKRSGCARSPLHWLRRRPA
ncbi:MAG TPA: hypothetical protein VFW91_12235, partial [Candidatus Binatia bacterium]|nr:hypothetical protein [Candidatus Binatia bacterium]